MLSRRRRHLRCTRGRVRRSGRGGVPRRPASRPAVTLAFEAHRLGLTSPRDLWYSGGGAFDEKAFGVNGRPATGHDDLLNVIDANVEWKVNSLTTFTLYAAHARGGGVMTAIF